jgi:SAM-dependent methyltransferase
MRRPARAAWAPERLDETGHPPAQHAASLAHVAQANRWLGGTRSLWRALEPLLPAGRPASILDVGTGSGDVVRTIVRRAARTHRSVRCIATERNTDALPIMRRTLRRVPEVRLAAADALRLPFADDAFDVALLTLTLHHLPDAHECSALRELGRVARAVIVAETERCWASYLGARLLAVTLWRRNPLTRHDGPASVLRGYTPDELLERAGAAGLGGARVERRFFYRLVLVAEGGAARAAAARTV